MSGEHTSTRHLAEILEAHVEAFLTSRDERTMLSFGEMNVLLEKAQDGRVVVRDSVHGSQVAELCPAGKERPTWYARGLPFVPLEMATVEMESSDDIVVTWFAVRNAVSSLAQILEQCIEDGWAPVERGSPPDAAFRRPNRHVLSKGDAARLVFIADGTVTLVQKAQAPWKR